MELLQLEPPNTSPITSMSQHHSESPDEIAKRRMGRKKGGKNAPGHRAGGARPGAGRKRKVPGQPRPMRAPVNQSSTSPNTTETVTCDHSNMIPMSSIHPDLRNWLFHPHDEHLYVSPFSHVSALQVASSPEYASILPRAPPTFGAFAMLPGASQIDPNFNITAFGSLNDEEQSEYSRPEANQSPSRNLSFTTPVAVSTRASRSSSRAGAARRGVEDPPSTPSPRKRQRTGPDTWYEASVPNSVGSATRRGDDMQHSVIRAGNNVASRPSYQAVTSITRPRPLSENRASARIPVPSSGTTASLATSISDAHPPPSSESAPASSEAEAEVVHTTLYDKRRIRHCKVCMEGRRPVKESRTCPGRGNRRLCPWSGKSPEEIRNASTIPTTAAGRAMQATPGSGSFSLSRPTTRTTAGTMFGPVPIQPRPEGQAASLNQQSGSLTQHLRLPTAPAVARSASTHASSRTRRSLPGPPSQSSHIHPTLPYDISEMDLHNSFPYFCSPPALLPTPTSSVPSMRATQPVAVESPSTSSNGAPLGQVTIDASKKPRRPRSCMSCLNAGNKEMSQKCPGRGSRALCRSVRQPLQGLSITA